MPWNLSGMGRRLLVSRRILVALIDSSPVLVFISVPSAPMMSPRSQFLKVGVHRLAHGVAGDVGWMRPGGVLHRGKAGLAHHALEHHAAAHARR